MPGDCLDEALCDRFELRVRPHDDGFVVGGRCAGAATAMLLGILESFTSTFYGPSWAPAVSFGVLLLTLAFRPAGLFGR